MSTAKPLVSIIVPIYNAQDYLKQCLESIINQSYEYLEILLINDGSTDKSLEILKEYASKDERITLIAQENKGAGYTRNKGLKLCKGEFVLFFDADDYMKENAIELLLTKALYHNADIVIAKSEEYFQKKHAFSPCVLRTQFLPEKECFNYKDMQKYIFNFTVGWAWDKFYKKDFILKNELFFQEIPSTNDLFFTFTSLVLAVKISVLDYELFIHRREVASSIENSVRKDNPLLFYQVLLDLRVKLEQIQVFDEVKASFGDFALGICIWNLMNLPEKSQFELFKLLKTQGFKQLCVYSLHKEDFAFVYNYQVFQILQLTSIRQFELLGISSISALEFVKNEPAYQLGKVILGAKSFKKFLKLPFALSACNKKLKQKAKEIRKQIKQDSLLKPLPLEKLPDFKDSLKYYNHLTFRLGTAALRAMKFYYIGGYVFLPFSIGYLAIKHKMKKWLRGGGA